MKKNKKMICIAMGAITSIVIPVTTIMSCGATTPSNNKIKKPTNATVPVNFYWKDGEHTYNLPKYKNTNITIKQGGKGITPSANLEAGVIVILIFTPNSGYTWEVGSNSSINIKYIVPYKAPDNTELNSGNFTNFTTYNKEKKSMKVWENVTKIDSNTFTDEYAQAGDIKILILPNTLSAIGKDTFNDYEIENLTLGSGLKTIADSAFHDSKLTSLSIPDSVTSIGESAFYSSLLTSLTFLGDIKSPPTLGFETFRNTKVSAIQGKSWQNLANEKWEHAFGGK